MSKRKWGESILAAEVEGALWGYITVLPSAKLGLLAEICPRTLRFLMYLKPKSLGIEISLAEDRKQVAHIE